MELETKQATEWW